MKFLTLTLLVILSLNVEAYKVRKTPFTSSVGVIQPDFEGDLTTNYNVMVNQPAKKLITLGLPEHVDLDKNIALGDRYEDVVYVKNSKSAGKKATAKNGKQRFAKKQDSDSSSDDEQLLDDILEIEFQADVNTAEEAFDAVLRHQQQILQFLDEISKEKEPTKQQKLVIKQLFKYVKLVQQAHDQLRSIETPKDKQFLDQIETTIHQYTMLLDEHKYNEARWDSTQKNLIGKSQDDNEELFEGVDDAIDRVVNLFDKDDTGVEDQLLATEKAEQLAQIAAKVVQTRILIDKVKHLHVEKNPVPQLELLEHYKKQIKAEQRLIHESQDRLDGLDQLFTENDELTEGQIQLFADDESLPTKTRAAAVEAIEAIEAEDEYQAEVKLDLVRADIRELIDDYAKTDALVSQHLILLMQIQDAITEGDMNEMEALLNEIIDETSEKQDIVLANTEITEQARIVRRSIRKGLYDQAKPQILKLGQLIRVKGYEKPSEGKLDASLSDKQHIQRKLDAEVQVLAELTKAAADLTLAEDRQQAEDFIEQVAQLTQQMVKVQKFREAQVASLKADDDRTELEAALEGLEEYLATELENLKTDREQMTKSRDNIVDLQTSSTVEDWEDSHKNALTIVTEENLNANARWAVTTAAQYIQLDVAYEVKVQLAKALKYVDQDLLYLEESLKAVETQQELLQRALRVTSSDDVVETLEEIILNIQTEQPVVEVSVEVQETAETAQSLLGEGDIEGAVDAVNRISIDIVDPYKESLDDVFDRAGEQPEGNGVEPDVGLDITENIKSPSELEHDDVLDQIQTLFDQVNEAVEEKDKLRALEAVENLFSFAQKQYKLIDVQTTVNSVKKAEEVGDDNDSFVQTINEFHDSNEEERTLLKSRADELLGLKESLEAIQSQFEEESNTEITSALNLVNDNDFANSEVRVQIANALEFLDTNKRASSLEAVETAVQRVGEQQDQIQLSLDGLDNQDEIVAAALESAEQDEYEEILENLESLEEAVIDGQTVVLTDTRLNELLEKITQNIREGKFEALLTNAQEITESLSNEINARREQDLADPTASPSEETQEAAAAELERDIENAEELVENGTKLEAQEAIELVEEQTQKDAKVKLIEEIKQDVKDALEEDDDDKALEAVDSLIAILEEEKSLVEEDKEEINQVTEQVEEVVDDADNGTADEVEEDTQDLIEEADDVEAVPASVDNILEEAQEASEEGNVGEAEEKLEEALEELKEEETELEKSEDIIDTQVESLKDAAEAIEDGDEEKALLEFVNIAASVDDQPSVQVSEDASEQAELAKEAVDEGNVDQAVELIEDIVGAADEEVQEQLEEADVEVEEESEEEEEENLVDEELVSLVEKVHSALTPEDLADIDQDDVLEAIEELNQYEGAQLYEVQISQIKISVESDDYAAATEQVEALLAFINPSESDLEEDDGVTKNLLPDLEARFHTKKTAAKKTALQKAAAAKQRMNAKVASLAKRFSKKARKAAKKATAKKSKKSVAQKTNKKSSKKVVSKNAKKNKKH